MSSDSGAPILFVIGLIAIFGGGTGTRHGAPASTGSYVPATQATTPSVQQSAQWDERSDCHPGATPNSLANALDVMHAHCDRAAAVARLAPLALLAVPLLGEAGLAEGAVGAGEASGGAAAAGELRAAGAAADATALREAAAGEDATIAENPRTYQMTTTERNGYEARPTDPAAADAYQVTPRGGGRYDVTSPASGRTHPMNVMRIGDDVYDVEASDGSHAVVNGQQLRQWYDDAAGINQTWQYEKR